MADPARSPKAALVTGAGRRIGRAIALGLARQGWAVAVHYGQARTEAESVVAEIAAAGGKALALQADLAETEALADLVRSAQTALGPLGCLVNNASIFEEDDIRSLEPDRWDRHQAVNLRAPLLLAKAFADVLPAEMVGNIINIVDQRVWRPVPTFLSYSVSKAGLWAATQMLAQALAPRIRVNAIGPGPVLASIYQSPEDFAAEAAGTLLGHGTSPAEIARAVLFILETPAMTGQMIALDGGQHLAWRTPDTGAQGG